MKDRSTRARNRYYSGPVSDHFDGVRFFNPDHPDTDRGLGDLLRWRLKEKAADWPDLVPARQVVPEARVTGLRATMIGHATVLIQGAGLNVLTDPFWSQRASPFGFMGPRRVCAPGVVFADLPPIDVVLLSHNHYDHLDADTLRRLQATHQPLIITPLGNDSLLRRLLPGARIATGDWWDNVAIGDAASATVVPAYHWSARGMSDRRMALWGGLVLHTAAGMVYFAGDTAYGSGAIFRQMRQRLGAPELALIPIGAYAPRWFMRDQHADPEDAVRIMEDLGARKAMGIHWGTVQLTDEDRLEPVSLLHEALERRGLDPATAPFQAAEPGDVIDI